VEDRRKYVRIPEALEVSYSLIPAKEMPRSNITKDISRGGIRFLVHDFIPKGSHLKIRLVLCRPSIAIEALVQIAWITGSPHDDIYEVGVEFIDIPQKAAELIAGCIKEFLRI
jgi:PilZ domain.